ncbi:MAG: PilZ domain-containing protein [Acidobacteriaceae bacterium]
MSPRHAADLRVRIALATPTPVILYARSVDLSTGGLSILLPHEGLGEAVATIGMKGRTADDYIWIRVRLRHRSGFRCGFQFIDTTAQQRSFIRLLCASTG